MPTTGYARCRLLVRISLACVPDARLVVCPKHAGQPDDDRLPLHQRRVAAGCLLIPILLLPLEFSGLKLIDSCTQPRELCVDHDEGIVDVEVIPLRKRSGLDTVSMREIGPFIDF